MKDITFLIVFVCRLLATHYPQLCLVEDWLDEELTGPQTLTSAVVKVADFKCNTDTLARGMFIIFLSKYIIIESHKNYI